MGQRAWVLLLAMSLFACRTEIQQNLDERQANEIQSVLTERGFSAEKVLKAGKKPTWSVRVERAQAIDAVRVLSELGLPKPKAPTSADLFASASLVPTSGEEQGRQLLALSGDLAQTLESIDGVVAARVHVALPDRRKGAEPTGAKASALLKVRQDAAERLVAKRNELAGLVAGAVEGLAPDDVTIVFTEVAAQVRAAPPARADGPLRVLAGVLAALSCLAIVGVTVLVKKQRAPERPAPRPTGLTPQPRKAA